MLATLVVEAWEGDYDKLMGKLKEDSFHPTVVVITFDNGGGIHKKLQDDMGYDYTYKQKIIV